MISTACPIFTARRDESGRWVIRAPDGAVQSRLGFGDDLDTVRAVIAWQTGGQLIADDNATPQPEIR